MVPLSFLAALALAAPPELPPPNQTPSAKKFSKVVGWPDGKMPAAPAGFTVTKYADKLDSPRWLYVLPNGDVLVAESKSEPKPKKDDKPKDEKPKEGDKPKDEKPDEKAGKEKSKAVGASANRITRLRGVTADGKAKETAVFAEGLKQPFGMALVGDSFYVANTNGVLKFPFKKDQDKLEGTGMKVLDLPEGGYNNHWTRNVLPNKDGTKLYVTVGSASNVGEHGSGEEMLRANVLEANPDGTALRVFASGLRNPVGLAWEPTSGALWTAVNERDELGDELVPDYMTSVKDGAFYGWPYSYFGNNEDPRRKGERPDLVAKATVPDVPLGSHTASLGLAFYSADAFPEQFRGGTFVGQHGSWNRSTFSGYKVVFVPFKDGKPTGPPQDFLTGFIATADEVYGRPVGVVVAGDGALLVADDASNCVWRVAYTGK